MYAVKQLVDRGKNLIDTTLLDQLCRYLILHEALAGEEPQPCVVRLVDVGELVDDEFEFEKLLLGAGVWLSLALVPSRNGFRAHVQDVGYVGRPHGALCLDGLQAACNRIAHGNASIGGLVVGKDAHQLRSRRLAAGWWRHGMPVKEDNGRWNKSLQTLRREQEGQKAEATPPKVPQQRKTA